MKRLYTILCAAVLALLPSCNFLDVEPQILVEETSYKTKDDLENGLAGVYGAMGSEAFYGNYYSLMCSNVDDLCYFNRGTTNSYIVWYRHDASSNEIYQVWTKIYAGVKNANNFMSAIEDSEFDPDDEYYNEARFLRAYYHFILAQAFGDVPLRDKPITEYDPAALSCPASPQEKVLEWAIEEMEACLEKADVSLTNAPSRVNKYTMEGIIARACLFMAGESVGMTDIALTKRDYLKKAMDYSYDVINSGKFRLNPDYSQVFINYITDTYDVEYYESMWEVDFLGDRSNANEWTNGRIGDLIGLQSNGSSDYKEFNCNYSYGQYDGSPKLWYLYTRDDRTDKEYGNILKNDAGETVKDEDGNTVYCFDARQEWNLPPYNYAGNKNHPPYGIPDYEGENAAELNVCKNSIDKSPYSASSVTTTEDPNVAGGIRNAGKYRRETEYEGHKDAKMLYTNINYPLLRYSDVLLMYAEAYNEYEGAPTQELFEKTILEVRNRAKVSTKDFSEYSSQEAFRELVKRERARELCFESLRKYDLIRWGEFVTAMHAYSDWGGDPAWTGNAKENYAISIGNAVQQRHIYLPIPNIELGVNTELRQNPLW